MTYSRDKKKKVEPNDNPMAYTVQGTYYILPGSEY